MSVSGEVNITIQMPATAGGETGTADGSAPSPASPKQETNTSADPVGGDSNGQVKLSAALQAAKGVGTQIINASVSSIGLATGNYYKQKKTERAMQVGGQLVGLAVSAFTNPLALVASISTIAISAFFAASTVSPPNDCKRLALKLVTVAIYSLADIPADL